MIKGVFLAMGIMVVLALIPVVDFIGIPFGPFIGGYYGISSARTNGGSYAIKSVVFGGLLGLLVLLVLVIVALALTLSIDLSQRFTLAPLDSSGGVHPIYRQYGNPGSNVPPVAGRGRVARCPDGRYSTVPW